jgi:plastocyanin
MSRFLPIICVSVVGVALLAGCGGSSNTTTTASAPAPASTPAAPAGKGQVIHLSADPGGALRFTRSTLTAKAGKVTLIMVNPSSAGMDHGIAIEGNGVDSDGATVGPGSTSTVSATLKKGTYTYYCPVPGHKQAGMVGTLTVS